MTQGEYEKAIPELRQYLADNPQSKNASRAGLFLGKVFLGPGRFEDAKTAFENTIREYPAALEAHKSRCKLGMISLLLDDGEDVQQRFQALASDPDESLAPEAKAIVEFLGSKLSEVSKQ